MLEISPKLVTSLNEKDKDGNYIRYEIGASSDNVSFKYNSTETTSVKKVLTNLQKGCLDSQLNFRLAKPLIINTSSTKSDIYDGTESKVIDLSKFLTEKSAWNNMKINTSAKKYISYRWNAGDQLANLSYSTTDGWKKTLRSSGSGWSYPKYGGTLTYRPMSLCKITLPKGTYLINYSIQVVNEYDKSLNNSNYTPNTGIMESNQVFFASGGKNLVNPGIISATLCSQNTFEDIQNHYYWDYYDDWGVQNPNNPGFYVPNVAFTAPRPQGTTFASCYTGHSMIYPVTSDNTIIHLLVTHYHEPAIMTSGYFVDSTGKKRIVCPVGGWIQITSLSN